MSENTEQTSNLFSQDYRILHSKLDFLTEEDPDPTNNVEKIDSNSTIDTGDTISTDKKNTIDNDIVEESKNEPNNDDSKADLKLEENLEFEAESEFGKLMQYSVDNGLLSISENSEYEDSEEGFKKLLEENIERVKTSAIDEYINKFNEDGKKIIKDYLEKGYSLEDYNADKNEYFDYDSINLESVTKEDKLNLIGLMLEKQGLNEELIEQQLKGFDLAQSVDKVAELAKETLKEYQTKEIKDKESKRLQEQEELLKLKQQQEENFKNAVLNTRDLAGLKLSENDAKDLYNFITETKPNGKTGLQEKDSEQARLFYAYLQMKDFDFKKLEEKAQKKQAFRFKKRIEKAKTIDSSNPGFTENPNNQSSSVTNEDQQRILSYYANLR